MKPPNILFLFADDQRFDTIAALGNPHIRTPHLDALVRQGTAFTHAAIMGGSCPAVCMPSRAMLMTGRSLFRIADNGARIPDDHALLGETLRAAGYATFGTGKWHNGPGAYARSFSAGAEIFFGGMDDHWNVPACRFDPAGRYDSAAPVCDNPWGSNRVRQRVCDHVTPGKHSSELFADAAVEFLHAHNGDAPFFAYVSFMAPHDPRTMPQRIRELYDDAALPLPPNFLPEHPFDNGELKIRDELLAPWPRTEAEIRRHIGDYYAMITHLDEQLGRILSALEDSGQADNTIVVFAGDNGLAVGCHGLMGKQNLYEHSIRVPLLFRGPGIRAGERREALCYLLDIFPTLCDLAGIPIPDTVEGRSLAPALRDPAARGRDALLLAYRDIQRGVRDERWKLIEYAVHGRRTTQLFDLAADPWEQHDLSDAPAHAPERKRLGALLQRLRDEAGDVGEAARAVWTALPA